MWASHDQAGVNQSRECRRLKYHARIYPLTNSERANHERNCKQKAYATKTTMKRCIQALQTLSLICQMKANFPGAEFQVKEIEK